MGLKSFENISKTTAVRGFQSFGLIEGAVGILSALWPKFLL